MNYKDTLNLPKTAFPMKAGLTKLEPTLLKRWEEEDTYKKLLALRKDAPFWVLHDGPPYANGHLHTGHALNKILKDIIIKSKAMNGYLSPYIPGWDCHGLPIEHQVDKNLGSKKREMSASEFRAYCRDYANKFIDIQREEFKRLGVFAEWDNPYITMNFQFEADIAKEFGKFALSGALFQSPKPVLWCGPCRTALAEAEVEYKNHQSPSIFVNFKLKDAPEKLHADLKGENVFLVIWTTTPWTLPANQAIAYNPAFKYGAYKLSDGRVLILVDKLANTLLEKISEKEAQKIATLETAKMLKLECQHPFYDRTSVVLPAVYVTQEQGTGLVHTAPGHGREDYDLGLEYGLEILSPLDNDARFTKEIEQWAGQNVLKTNESIIEYIKEKGALLFTEMVEHQYPHCWRCKKPVIFRSTPQWFIAMDATNLRQKALKAIDEVKWIPQWGRGRIHSMIENRPDWCISRQRSWGVPITVFLCKECGQWHYSEGIMSHLYEIFKEQGADAWFSLTEKELMPEGEKCLSCGHSEFEKETDILDVWFDSGSTFAATLEARDYMPNQANMYLEGSDQHRGWFHSSLLVSVASRDRAPYQEVLTHGYVVDATGRKMSKSENNVIAPDYVINKYGADILRLWVAAEDYKDDIRLSDQILDMIAKAYFHFRNTCRFILGNLSDFNPQTDLVPYENLSETDKLILHNLNQLIMKVKDNYNEYEFHTIYHLINNFVGELSAFYHDIVKDCLYTFKTQDPKRRAIQTVMYTVLNKLARLMAPILSFTCEEIWGYMPGAKENESVFLKYLPTEKPEYNQPELANKWNYFLKLRDVVNKSLEEARQEKIIGAPLDAHVILKAGGKSYKILKDLENQLDNLFIVSSVELKEDNTVTEIDSISLIASVLANPHNKCPRCWIRHPEVPEDLSKVCPKCQKALQ